MKSLKCAILGPGLIEKDFSVAMKEVNGKVYAVFLGAEVFDKQYEISKAY